MAMTDIQARTAKAKEKAYKLSDEKGLFLLVTPSGGKWWRFKYRIGGKEKLLALGTYPEISLADARERRDTARKQVANDIDPGEVKKAKKAARIAEVENTFEAIARQWHEQEKHRWSDNHAGRLLKRLENDIFPAIGNRPISSVKTPEMEQLLLSVAARTLETAHRLKIACDMVYRFAIRKELAENNPVAALKGVLPTVKYKHMAAPTDPKAVTPLLKAIDGFVLRFP